MFAPCISLKSVQGLANMGVRWATMPPRLKKALLGHLGQEMFLLDSPYAFNITNVIKQLGE